MEPAEAIDGAPRQVGRPGAIVAAKLLRTRLMRWIFLFLVLMCRLNAADDAIKLYENSIMGSGVNAKCSFSVPAVRFFEVPTWTPGDGPPPLDFMRAFEIARAAYDGSGVRPTLRSVELRGQNGRWWYVVDFNEKLLGFDPSSAVVVLMNGVRVMPKITKGPGTIYSP